MTYVKVEPPESSADDEVMVEEHVPASPPAEEPEPITDYSAAAPMAAPGRTLLVGGLATATLLVTGLYQLAGIGGLVGGGAAVAGAGAAYVAHRRGNLFRKRPGRGGAGGDSATAGGSHRTRRGGRSGGAQAAHPSGAGNSRSRRGGKSRDGWNFPRGKSNWPGFRRSPAGGGPGSASTTSRHGGGRQKRFGRVRAWVDRRTGRAGGWQFRFRPDWSGTAARYHAWDSSTRIGLHALLARLVTRARRLLGKTASPTEQPDNQTVAGAQPGEASTAQQQTSQPTTPNPTHRIRSPRMDHVTYAATGENPLVLMSVEILNAASLYDVPRMMTVSEHLDSMFQVPENLALAFTRFGQRLQAAHPIHAVVVQEFAEVVKGFAAVIPATRQLAVTFKGVHADDIAKHDAPRVNEHKWDINA
ncbi:hypothetical protein [Nonomuraea sp. JJY05]|uniref:hypothetical protein n=1 Tax=Nonomuraea sp. JJY05 TaxID=3350255 RepID=UPI00373FB93C